MSAQKFWKTKLAAFLHDPPDKCLDIAGHEQAAEHFQIGAGLVNPGDYDGWAVKAADVFTAAADRFGFPKGKCATIYKETGTGAFIHPLSSTAYELDIPDLLARAGEVHGILQSAIHGIDPDDAQTTLFLYWRCWLENSVTSLPTISRELAFLPADTRIPDHTIWQHNAMASALAGCAVNGKLQPALLLFQLGGVQEFISQARSTRDLWSGSYLLSWLMAHAMKAVSDQVGADAVVFPNLRGNGIFDALHRESIYEKKMFISQDKRQESLWQRMLAEKNNVVNKLSADQANPATQWLTTPTLPNRFLAVVPADRAESLAQAAANALKQELKTIGDAVWEWLAKEAADFGSPGIDNWKQRWDAQIQAFPQISWAVQPWLEREECLSELEALPINRKGDGDKTPTPLETLQNTLLLAEEWLDEDDRDARYYLDKAKTRLSNSGIFWSAHYALVDARLAARRNTRDFQAWENPWPEASVKDSLSGKEEIIGDEEFWKKMIEKYGRLRDGDSNAEAAAGQDTLLFTAQEHKYGAMNLIKRLWCREDQVPYLRERLGLDAKNFRLGMGFDSVQEIAERNLNRGAYVAVLAMDGDEMGKWVSGDKAPPLLDQLSEPARQFLEPILKQHDCKDLRRLLSPSYHLQFSEALANFATWLARPIVEAFGGQLVYAGGDDVLAMLPADQAINCARALRAVFRGEAPENMTSMPLNIDSPGFVTAGAGYPLLVPGEKTDVSVGLAIGHEKAPLQMLVKEAQAAESRAKHDYGRGAIAFSLYKRSGEIIQWGCKWDSAALPLMETLDQLSPLPKPDDRAPDGQNEDNARKWELSERFPYALAALLEPYQLHRSLTIKIEEIHAIIKREVEHVISRQGKSLLDAAKKDATAKQQLQSLEKEIETWLQECVDGENAHKKHKSGDKSSPENNAVGRLRDFIQPFLTETFIHRDNGGEQ
ncbi:MAG: type III-B CRISPR-associated protein Cas10/Cmr2 [Lentisphaerae bacterium]|nr:type III-B CRISPR-associated protein Cas10/Cmr2 [Lentisphaerota bacterium]